jgi:hypothetical protein
MCVGGYGNIENRENKRIKEYEVVGGKDHRQEYRCRYSQAFLAKRPHVAFIPPLPPQRRYAAVPHAHIDTGYPFHYRIQGSAAAR